MSLEEQQNDDNKDLAYYCDIFHNLRVNSDKRYQPLLLLAVIDLFAKNKIETNKIIISPDLIQSFISQGSNFCFFELSNSSFSQPFFHLHNNRYKFWHLDFKTEYYLENKRTIDDRIRKSLNQLKMYVNHAYLDEPLFELLQEEDSRRELSDVLVKKWLTQLENLSQNNLEYLLKVNQELQKTTQQEVKALLATSTNKNKTLKYYMKRTPIRDAVFRQTVTTVYDYRCILCELKIIRYNPKTKIQKIVDGAHIKPFSKFYDDSISNGISLCKNHHWAFDRGWFSINKEYRIIVCDDLLEEESKYSTPLKIFYNKKILLPDSNELYPDIQAINWHRKNVFKGSTTE